MTPRVESAARRRFGRELGSFVRHLRWPYQIAVVSGAYLLGALYQPELDALSFLVQFLNVHLLLLGGATVYNSFWDHDEGPVGGLRHPPPLAPWTRPASWVVQVVGVLVATLRGSQPVALYLLSMLLFWLYSGPHARWKAHPYRSLVVVGIANGFNVFAIGYLAAGRSPPDASVLLAGTGVGLPDRGGPAPR